MPEIDGIEVGAEDLFFTEPPFQLPRQFDFLEFSHQRLFSGELRVFDELLADRGAALPERSGFQVGPGGAGDPAVIQAVVFVKGLVFCGDKGVFHVRGQLFGLDAFLCGRQGDLRHLFIVCVINGNIFSGLFEFGRIQAGPARHGKSVYGEGGRGYEQQAKGQKQCSSEYLHGQFLSHKVSEKKRKLFPVE